MSKKNKIIISVIVVIAILAVCVFAYEKTTNKKEEKSVVSENVEQEDEQLQEENTVENEVIVDDVVEDNTIEEPNEDIQGAQVPSQETTTLPDSTSVYQSQGVYEKDSDVGTTNKKEEAIELVKQTWGEDNTVTFSCDSVTTEGEYIIAVTSLETATVRNYFRVNLSTKSVEVEY